MGLAIFARQRDEKLPKAAKIGQDMEENLAELFLGHHMDSETVKFAEIAIYPGASILGR